jgi:DNA-binding FrmR family transcriptional regulator
MPLTGPSTVLYSVRPSAHKVVTVNEQQLADKDELLARLRRVEGQIRGIQRMVVDERDCEAIVTQLLAARAALDRTSMVILMHHMQQCLADPSGRPSQKQLQRIIEFFVKFAGPVSESQPVIEE